MEVKDNFLIGWHLKNLFSNSISYTGIWFRDLAVLFAFLNFIFFIIASVLVRPLYSCSEISDWVSDIQWFHTCFSTHENSPISIPSYPPAPPAPTPAHRCDRYDTMYLLSPSGERHLLDGCIHMWSLW